MGTLPALRGAVAVHYVQSIELPLQPVEMSSDPEITHDCLNKSRAHTAAIDRGKSNDCTCIPNNHWVTVQSGLKSCYYRGALNVLELSQAALAFGGLNRLTSASTSRTIMVAELTQLLAETPIDATAPVFRAAIIEENLLLKPTVATREKTYHSLKMRYALDPSVPIFAVQRTLWNRDPEGQPLIALLVAAFRDPLLRAVLPLVIDSAVDSPLRAGDFRTKISEAFPDEMSERSLQAASERMTSTFAQSGHLRGRTRRVRQRVHATPGSVAIALLLASFENRGGMRLLESHWVALLDTPPESLLAEARVAAQRGWLEYRQAGDVLEIGFRGLYSAIGMS